MFDEGLCLSRVFTFEDECQSGSCHGDGHLHEEDVESGYL